MRFALALVAVGFLSVLASAANAAPVRHIAPSNANRHVVMYLPASAYDDFTVITNNCATREGMVRVTSN